MEKWCKYLFRGTMKVAGAYICENVVASVMPSGLPTPVVFALKLCGGLFGIRIGNDAANNGLYLADRLCKLAKKLEPV